MTLGEWLNQMIIEGGEPEALPSEEEGEPEKVTRRSLDELYNEASAARPPVDRSRWVAPNRAEAFDAGNSDVIDDELSRATRALDQLSARLEATEHRSALAISGIDQSVMGVLSRLEDLDQSQSLLTEELADIFTRIGDAQARLSERLRRVELDTGSSSAALPALQQSPAALWSQISGSLSEKRWLEASPQPPKFTPGEKLEDERLSDALNQIAQSARDVLGTSGAPLRWLKDIAISGFGGKTAEQLVATGHGAAVLEYINELRFGVRG